MRRVILWIFAALVVGVAAVPAVATHIQEPTAPITGLRLKMWKYADSATIVDCSTVQDVAFDNLRVDAFVLATGAPSEHFTVRGAIYKLTPAAVVVSRAVWQHQNAPPHAPVSLGWYGFWMDQPNLSQHQAIQTGGGLTGGLWKVDITITGQESGMVFTQTCTFRKVASTV